MTLGAEETELMEYVVMKDSKWGSGAWEPSSRLAKAAAGAAAAVTLLAGCSSSPTKSQSASTSSTAAISGLSQSDLNAIKTAYSTLFDLANSSVSAKVQVVQDGASIQQAMATELGSSLAKAVTGAKILSVKGETTSGCSAEALTPPCAQVQYQMMAPNGQPILGTTSISTGYAVKSAGKWYVAKATICSLLSLANSGNPPNGC